MARPFCSVSGLEWQGIEYFCTQRAGGYSTGPLESFNMGLHVGDDEAVVRANRRLLAMALPGEPLWLTQVHGTEVIDADTVAAGTDASKLTADAAVTTSPGRVLAIMTADCLPVVLGTFDGAALGVAHAGWRGLAGGILERTVAQLRQKARHFANDEVRIRAWVGPGISQTHFEVGLEVYEAFVGQDPGTGPFFIEKLPGHKWHADLAGLARHRLLTAGVESVQLSGECTFSRSELYYSYRREPHTGRMATVAWIES